MGEVVQKRAGSVLPTISLNNPTTQVCVMKEPQMLEFAAEQFVGKTQKDLEDIILQTIEGHFRAILGK